MFILFGFLDLFWISRFIILNKFAFEIFFSFSYILCPLLFPKSSLLLGLQLQAYYILWLVPQLIKIVFLFFPVFFFLSVLHVGLFLFQGLQIHLSFLLFYFLISRSFIWVFISSFLIKFICFLKSPSAFIRFIILVLRSLFMKSMISLIFVSISVKYFLFWLWVIFICFFKVLVIFLKLIYFKLEDNCFTVLCCFCHTSTWIDHSHAYVPSLWNLCPPPTPPRPLGCHRALVWAPCIIQGIPTGCLFCIR